MKMRFSKRVGAVVLVALVVGCGALAPQSPGAGSASSEGAWEAISVPDPLTGTRWVLTAMATRELLPHRRITLEFAPGDRIRGADDCSPYAGKYMLDARGLRVEDVASEAVEACPAATAAQTRVYLATMDEVTRFELGDGELHLTTAAGEALLSFVAADRVLPGTRWTVVGYDLGGRLQPVLAGTTISVDFGTNGRVSGSAGCNQFVADYDTESYAIQIGVPRSTRKSCAEPAGIMQQEQHFLGALHAAVNVWFHGDRLELRTSTGTLAATMRRAAEAGD